MDVNELPLALVKTWVSLIKSKEDAAVREHATKMLLGAFGDLEAVAKYCKENGIDLT